MLVSCFFITLNKMRTKLSLKEQTYFNAKINSGEFVTRYTRYKNLQKIKNPLISDKQHGATLNRHATE